MFLMWLGEQITERMDIGNGISLIILRVLLLGLPMQLVQLQNKLVKVDAYPVCYCCSRLLCLLLPYFVVFVGVASVVSS